MLGQLIGIYMDEHQLERQNNLNREITIEVQLAKSRIFFAGLIFVTISFVGAHPINKAFFC